MLWKTFLDVDELIVVAICGSRFSGLFGCIVCMQRLWYSYIVARCLFTLDEIKEMCKIQKSELRHLECGEGGQVSSGFWRKSSSVW